MSDDLVTQLRTYFGSPLLSVSHQAADEIERLRAENARLREALREIAGARPQCCEITDTMQYIARAALEQSEPKP